MHPFDKLRDVVTEIRNKCPWDREQTHESLKKYLIEECYEVVDAIDDVDPDELVGELGDVLLQVMLHAEIASEKNQFDVETVIEKITEKMIVRHPHVFKTPGSAETADQVVENWEVIKAKTSQRKSVLDGIPRHLPALMRAQRLQSKASNVGFDWKDDLEPVLTKIREEMDEFAEALLAGDSSASEKEFGDVLFSLVNLGRLHGFDVESALQQTNEKFRKRFQYIESKYDSASDMKDAGLAELDRHWEDAKGAVG